MFIYCDVFILLVLFLFSSKQIVQCIDVFIKSTNKLYYYFDVKMKNDLHEFSVTKSMLGLFIWCIHSVVNFFQYSTKILNGCATWGSMVHFTKTKFLWRHHVKAKLCSCQHPLRSGDHVGVDPREHRQRKIWLLRWKHRTNNASMWCQYKFGSNCVADVTPDHVLLCNRATSYKYYKATLQPLKLGVTAVG